MKEGERGREGRGMKGGERGREGRGMKGGRWRGKREG